MKSILIAAVIILSQSSTAVARDIPPLPYDDCRRLAKGALEYKCQGPWGLELTCWLRDNGRSLSWICD